MNGTLTAKVSAPLPGPYGRGRVLVFTPTWTTATGWGMREETQRAIRAQRFDGELRWEIGLDNPYPIGSHRNVLHQYRKARQAFLAGDHDALMFIEHDMVPPPDAVQKLWDTPADVVYGVYLLRHGMLGLNTFEYVNDRNIGESLSNSPDKLALARAWGTYRVSGAGFGCILIRRKVVEMFDFHDEGDTQHAPDMPFAKDCLAAGVVSLARFDVACDHFDGVIRLRPYGDSMGDMAKVRALQDVVFLDAARGQMRLEVGKSYELSRRTLSDAVRGGYVTVEEPLEAIQTAQDARIEVGTADMTREAELAVLEPSETAVRRQGKRKRKGL